MGMNKVFQIFILASFMAFGVNGQSALYVGFNSALAASGSNNEILKSYNLKSNVTETINPLRLNSGFELGYLYGNDVAALTLSFGYNRKESSGMETNLNGDILERKLQYNFISYSAGAEIGAEDFRLGGTIGYRRSRIKSSLGDVDLTSLVSEGNMVSRLYLMYRFKGSGLTSLAIRPYIDFAWSPTNVTALQNELTGTNTAIYQDKFQMFGLSLLFINGAQYD